MPQQLCALKEVCELMIKGVDTLLGIAMRMPIESNHTRQVLWLEDLAEREEDKY